MARWRSSPVEQDALKASIMTVIDLVFKKREEVALVAMYRKEACEELLCARKVDLPETSTGREEFFPAGTIQVCGTCTQPAFWEQALLLYGKHCCCMARLQAVR
jgi:hypothetical protein